MMAGLDRRPLRRHPLTNGAPRHFHARCSADCGWRGTRTADRAEDIPLGRKCPKCGSTVEVASA